MEIEQDAPQFRPVTLRLYTEDDFDQLVAIVLAVAQNRINHTPAMIGAATRLAELLARVERD